MASKANLNTSSQADLAKVEQIGKVLAKRIFESKPFTKWEEVERLHRIGPWRIRYLKEVFVLEDSDKISANKNQKDEHDETDVRQKIVWIDIELKV